MLKSAESSAVAGGDAIDIPCIMSVIGERIETSDGVFGDEAV